MTLSVRHTLVFDRELRVCYYDQCYQDVSPGVAPVPGLGLPPDNSQTINPISRLIQIQQAKKEKEPVYTLIDERGMPRRREFVIQVSFFHIDNCHLGYL